MAFSPVSSAASFGGFARLARAFLFMPRRHDTAAARARARFLSENPLCAKCLERGQLTPAEQVDHIIPLSKGGAEHDDLNKQSLCIPCHKKKTADDMGYKQKGCDVNGEPTSSSHWWTR